MRNLKRNPEGTPAGAPPGFDYAAVLRCYVRPFALLRRSAQDDTEGYSGRETYNSHPFWIERKTEQHMGRSLQNEQSVLSHSTKHRPAERSEGGTPRLCLKSSVEPSSEPARRARNFTAQGNRIRSA